MPFPYIRVIFRSSVSFLLGLVALNAVSLTTQAQTAQNEHVVVTGAPVASPTPYDNWKEKRDHLMPEVKGTQITVTKKATVIKLEQQPPIQNNDLQQEFLKAPGLLVSEQNNPGQFNLNYRGLGFPQESEFVTVLQDGLPLASDWIGFPTLYSIPVPQSVQEIQVIRGGSSLLYGPEPAPAVNFVMKHPEPGTPWNSYVEQSGGPYGQYTSHAAVQEASGPVELRLDGTHATSEGWRDNGDYNLWQSNAYIGWRPDDKQLTAVDVHVSRFDGGDPGRLTYQQYQDDPTQTVSPYNRNWVDRYSVVLRHEHQFGDNWYVEAKGWYTHEDIDSRAANNYATDPKTGKTVLVNGNPVLPTNTVLAYEEFNNGGVDLRIRHDWGDGTMFKGSSFTFGGVAYHGDAPFERYTLQNLNSGNINNPGGLTLGNYGLNFLYAPRGTRVNTKLQQRINGVTQEFHFPTLDQDRTSDYQAFFLEDLFRLGKFHVVGSFRLDHENVDVKSNSAPFLSPPLNPAIPAQAALIGADHVSADHWIPLWGFGMGNDFGDRNETYFSASSGWRPTRFFDIAGTRNTIIPGQEPDPFKSLDFELGVHGTPLKGFWYDLGLFWMQFENRTENIALSSTEFFVQNSGDTRHRGFEGELSYDFLARFQSPPVAVQESKDFSKDATVDKNARVPGVSLADWHPLRLIVFSNVQVLDADFTDSDLFVTSAHPLDHPLGKSLVGNAPSFAPNLVWKGGISFRKEKCFNVQLDAIYSSSYFWNDANTAQPAAGTFNAQGQHVPLSGFEISPAKVPSFYTLNLSGEYYVTKNVRVFGAITNLTDLKYYSRAFPFNGLIEPAPSRTGWVGVSVEF